MSVFAHRGSGGLVESEGAVEKLEDCFSLRRRKALEPLKSEHHFAVGLNRRDGPGFAQELIACDLEGSGVSDDLLKRNAPDAALDLGNVLGLSPEEFCELPLAEAALLSEGSNSLADLLFREDHVFGG